MKKKHLTLLLLLSATLAFAEGKTQTICPIMGGKINKALYADVDGYRIYVCCKGCIAPIKADPKKIIEKMKADGIEPEKAPTSDAKSGATKKWNKRK